MKNTVNVATIVGILLFSSFVITPSISADPGGDTLYVGGSGSGNYSSIQDAINNASDGDTVYVYNGTYYENVIVNKSVNLVGEDRNTTTIYSNMDYVVYLTSDNVKINEFTIKGTAHGIYMKSNYSSVITNNISCRWNIYLSNSSSNIISGNIISSNKRYGIIINSSSSNIISGNTLYGNNYGMYIYGSSSDNVISANTIYNNNFALAFFQYGESSINNTIIGNNIYDNGFGITIRGSGSCSNIISENTISSSDFYGIYICYFSEYNLIYHNNFINNVQNAYDNSSNTWDDGYPSGGNYFDDYNEIDADGDGIGDTPYNISGGENQDRYPLMLPFGENLPVADFIYSSNILTVTFDASSSYDRDGYITNYSWDFGDGTNSTSTNPVVEHTYEQEYTTYTVNLTVIDDDGNNHTFSKLVTTNDTTIPEVKIEKPLKGLYIKDRFIRRRFLRVALVIGDLTIQINASDAGSEIEKVEFIIDGKVKNTSYQPIENGLYTYKWTRDRIRLLFHLHSIKAKAYDHQGNMASTKTRFVRRFL